jgi:hypothetical protein
MTGVRRRILVIEDAVAVTTHERRGVELMKIPGNNAHLHYLLRSMSTLSLCERFPRKQTLLSAIPVSVLCKKRTFVSATDMSR